MSVEDEFAIFWRRSHPSAKLFPFLVSPSFPLPVNPPSFTGVIYETCSRAFKVWLKGLLHRYHANRSELCPYFIWRSRWVSDAALLDKKKNLCEAKNNLRRKEIIYCHSFVASFTHYSLSLHITCNSADKNNSQNTPIPFTLINLLHFPSSKSFRIVAIKA